MTDLTEQWKKGELPSGTYWLKTACTRFPEVGYYVGIDGKVDFYKKSDGFRTKNVLAVEQVLAPVPSYEEWKASEKYNKHLEEVIKIYERKEKQATETSIAYNDLLEENAKLKTDCNTLAQKLLQVKPELREWLEVNYGEYL